MFQRSVKRRSSLFLEGSDLPGEIRMYLEKHKLEPILTKAFNEMIKILPIDPFSDICSILKTESKDIFSVNSITIKDVIIEDFQSIPSLELIMTYKGATRTVLTYPIPFSSLAYEKYTASKDELLNTFNEIFSEEVKNLDYEDPNQFDEKVLNILKTKNKENKETDAMALSLSNTISLMIFISTALMKNINFSQFIAENKCNLILKKQEKNKGRTPNLGFCIFKTGKSMNSKIKYERFLIMVNNEIFENNNDINEKKKIIIDLYKKMFEIIKKTLTAGKAGENGMKTNNEGSFTPPSDKYEDVLKLMEGFIKEINTAMNNQNVVSLGIDFNAENFFNPVDVSYEPEGVKKAIDNTQLVDSYVKLIADHPLLTYLEQPMAYDDQEGWGLLLEKFKDKPNISIVQKVDIYRKEPEPKVETNEPTLVLNLDKKEEVKKEEPKPKAPEKTKKANKKKKKNAEVAKTEDTQNKTNENFKKEKPKIGMFSYRLGEANVISQLFNNILKKKETNPNFGGVIYENDIEGKQDGIIQLGMALNFDYIILNGVTMTEQKITKIKSYIEELDNASNIKNLPEDEVKDLKKDNPTNQNNEPPKEEDKNKGNIEQKNNENVNPK